MSEFRKGEWKVVLGSEKRKIVHPTKKTTRTAEIFTIVTNDKLNLILREWELGEESDKGTIEIDGVFYKKYGTDESYHKDFGNAINKHLENKKFSPDFDVKSVKDVEKLYDELNELGKELYKLDKR